MQNYLANKSFNRGRATHEASASMVFVGNTKHTVPYMLRKKEIENSLSCAQIYNFNIIKELEAWGIGEIFVTL